VQGKATDDVQVAFVAYQLNTNGWFAATGSTNWTAANLMLMPGTNNFSAYAVDTSGNVSTTNTVNFIYLPNAVLTVTTNGNGTVSPNYNGALLQIGKSYSITATAGMGFAFTNWTGGTNLPLNVITNGTTVQFLMVSNLMLQANFVDVTKPTISITSPTSGSTYLTNVSSINLGGTASDNVGVTQVTWSNNRGGNGTASGTTSWSITGIALQSGTNLITVVAYDAAGNTNKAALTVTNDTTPPTVNITSPTSGSTYLTNVSSINLGGTASDSVGVTQVTWSNNRGGNGTASGTTAWSITGIALQGGTNIITVAAHDTAGNSGNATLSVKYNLPALGIVRQNSKIVLTWPTNAADFTLENATNLIGTVWTTNSSSMYIVNGQITVTNTLTNGSKFYRLLKP
jgi:hypothetical protein